MALGEPQRKAFSSELRKRQVTWLGHLTDSGIISHIRIGNICLFLGGSGICGQGNKRLG